MGQEDNVKSSEPRKKAPLTASGFSTSDLIFFKPLMSSGKLFYLFVAILVSIFGLGVYAFLTQFQDGLIVTGLREPVFWGVYMANFIFFAGIAMAGTLISAVLQLAHAEWRKPITRLAESITVSALLMSALMPMIDIGRPDRFLNVFLYGRIQSPIIWDMLSLTSYLIGSTIFLYLPLIPDIAELRDRLTSVSPIRRWIYKTLSLGWVGSEMQWRRLKNAMRAMTLVIVPVAVSIHTVLAWTLAVQFRAGWHSAMFGAFFVGGAVFSGTAALIIAIGIFRKVYHLEHYLTLRHFKNLSYIVVTLGVIMIYLNINEYLTAVYVGEIDDLAWMGLLFNGSFSLPFYLYVFMGLIIPIFIIAIPRTRTIPGIMFASLLVVIGMWLERYVIISAPLANPIMPYPVGLYTPSWVEWAITAGAFAGFILTYTILAKLFPIMSRWELFEGSEKGHKEH